MTTGKRIQAARKRANLSQRELGEKLGVSASMIGQYENDLRKPKFETLRKIADALEIPAWELLGGKSDTGSDVISFDLTDEQFSLISSMGIDITAGYPFDPTSQEADALMEVITGLTNEQETTKTLLSFFAELNIWGQRKAIERIQELCEIPRYKKQPPQD